jgi:hypothetical protein
MPRGGVAFLSGAHAIPVQRKLMSLSQADYLAGWFSFSRSAAAVHSSAPVSPCGFLTSPKNSAESAIRVIAEIIAAIE